MLATLRSKTGGVIAKAFVGLLALSFAVWGINDIFTGYRGDALVTIGETEISRADFENAQRLTIRQLSIKFKRNIQPDEVNKLGINRKVLGDLIREGTLDEQAVRLNLAISEDEISRQIANNSNYQDRTGVFNPTSFRQALKNARITEDLFILQERQRILRNELVDAVNQEVTVPETLTKAAWTFDKENRTARYFVLPNSAAETPADPDESELKSYYDGRKRTFTAPEYRALSLLRLQPANVAKTVSISAQDLRAAYENRIEEFSVQEKRIIQQIVFSNEQEAQAAHKRILEGIDFLQIAKEKGLSEQDYNLGALTQAAVLDPVIGETAFGLEKGKVSPPVSGALSTVLVRVTDIIPSSRQPFDTVKAKLENDLKLEQAKEEIFDMHDLVEDNRAAGDTLPEIGKMLNLPVQTVEAIDRAGKNEASATVEDIPGKAAVLRLAFDSDVGVENDPVETPEGGFVWLDVIAVTPEALKPFNEVKDKVKELWIASKKDDALRATARKLVDEANKGANFEALAKDKGQEIKTSAKLNRRSYSGALDQIGIQTLFATPKGKTGMTKAPGGEGILIFETLKVTEPAFPSTSDPAVNQITTVLRNSISQDILEQYLVDLQANMGVEINKRMWSQIQSPGT